MDLSKITAAIDAAAAIADKGAALFKLIEAGAELANVVRGNVEEAAAAMTTADAALLRAQAEQLAIDNRALAEQLDALLKG